MVASTGRVAVRDRDCLVGVVSTDADLARFLQERWYRIPERTLGRALARDALDSASLIAIYQSGSLGTGLPGAIEWFADIERVERVRRRDLIVDEPTHPAADEQYLVVRLSAPTRLPRPILSRRARRITFIRTTRSRILCAEDVNDLIVGTPEEERLWQRIRHLDAERRTLMNLGGTVMEVDFAVFSGERSVGLLCRDQQEIEPAAEGSDWSVLRFSPVRLRHDLEGCLEELRAELGRG